MGHNPCVANPGGGRLEREREKYMGGSCVRLFVSLFVLFLFFN